MRISSIGKTVFVGMMISAFALSVSCPAAMALAGSNLKGSVRESRSGEALPGANVLIVGTSMGASTDLNGKFVVGNVPPYFINGRTRNMFDNTTAWPGLHEANNDTVDDPGFASSVTSQEDSLIHYVKLTRTGGLATHLWDYDPGNQPLYPPAWPLPENLRYTNTAMIHGGTDGYALGDLRWFPEQKATWVLGVKTVANALPEKFDLSNNYPNPFNPSTDIRVSLKQAGEISLTVYNVLGQVVQVVDRGYKPAGEYIYNVNMDRFASGVYFYTLRQGASSITKKMLLLK